MTAMFQQVQQYGLIRRDGRWFRPRAYRHPFIQWHRSPGQQAPNPEAIHYDRHRVLHHFYLYPDGGMMTLVVADPSDIATRKAVRTYVQRVSQLMVVGNLGRMREPRHGCAPLVTEARAI